MSNKLNVCWWGDNYNFGDYLNKSLCEKISRKKVKRIPIDVTNSTQRYYVIGSILQEVQSSNYEIWGSGFISKRARLKYIPNKIHAVRGPLTRVIIINKGVECPEVYGDPALIYPKLYKPKVKKNTSIGIIPHYADKKYVWLNKINRRKNIKVIDIENKNVHHFINEVLSCDIIFSSSLHGLIIADAYDIKSYWFQLSDEIVGDNFKFNDYFLSVNRPIIPPLQVKLKTTFKDLQEYQYNYSIDFDFDRLYNSCPFKS